MKMRYLVLGMLCWGAIGLTTAAQSASGDVELETARKTAVFDGNLKTAIEQYKRIAERYATLDRAVAAEALLRTAESYRKLGNPTSRQVYEQVARNYGDLPAAAVARTQLGTPAGGVTTRAIWNYGDRAVWNVSTNGKVLTTGFGFGPGVGDLLLRDLASGIERPIGSDVSTVNAGPAVLSRDGTFVVYSRNERLWTLQIKEGARQPSSMLVQTGFRPIALSPDKTVLVAQGEQPDQTAQLRVISMADGTMRTLKSLNWQGTSNAFFSPDGRFLLYDAPQTDSDLDRDVFVIAIDGSRESAIAHPKDDRVAGWSPDGRSVFFTSDRRGPNDLWRQAVIDGRASASPELIVPEVGTVDAMGVTGAGAVYLNRSVGGPDVETIGIDFATGRQTSAPARPLASNVGFNRRPAWSPDGKSLLAVLADPVIVIHSMQTGRDRELSLVASLTWISGPTWSPDGRQIAVIGNDIKGRHGVFRIDAATGAVTAVTFMGSTPFASDTGRRLTYEGPMWSPDGTKLYYHTANSGGGAVLEWTLATGQEREIIRGVGTIGLSPHGRSIATYRTSANRVELVIVPVTGGTPRALWQLGEGESVNNTTLPWTPDGRAVIVRRNFGTCTPKTDLWLVPVDGSPRRRLEVDTARMAVCADGRFGVHPDGRQLAYLSSDEWAYQVTAVENIPSK